VLGYCPGGLLRRDPAEFPLRCATLVTHARLPPSWPQLGRNPSLYREPHRPFLLEPFTPGVEGVLRQPLLLTELLYGHSAALLRRDSFGPLACFRVGWLCLDDSVARDIRMQGAQVCQEERFTRRLPLSGILRPDASPCSTSAVADARRAHRPPVALLPRWRQMVLPVLAGIACILPDGVGNLMREPDACTACTRRCYGRRFRWSGFFMTCFVADLLFRPQ